MKYTFLVVLSFAICFGGVLPAAAATPSADELRVQLEQLSRTLETLKATKTTAPAGALTQASASGPQRPIRPNCRVTLDKSLYMVGEKMAITVAATNASEVKFMEYDISTLAGITTLPTLTKTGGKVTLPIVYNLGGNKAGSFTVRALATSATGHMYECAQWFTLVSSEATRKDTRLQTLYAKVNQNYEILSALYKQRDAINEKEITVQESIHRLFEEATRLEQQGQVVVTEFTSELTRQTAVLADFAVSLSIKNNTKKPVTITEDMVSIAVDNDGQYILGTTTINPITLRKGGGRAIIAPEQEVELLYSVRMMVPRGVSGYYSVEPRRIEYGPSPFVEGKRADAVWSGIEMDIDEVKFGNPKSSGEKG